ncbi:MAG TPA: hypothetical protein VHM02_07010 [Thermoanaerobaculia bacterium]|nr:hypothetical protein [Thermoanaerobaculia bacterium]
MSEHRDDETGGGRRRDEDWELDETWEVVATVGTDEEANLLAGYLRTSDVPAEVESLRFHQEPVNFGSLGEVRVRVPMEHRAAALELLSARQTEGLAAEAEAAERAGEAEGAGGPEEG